MHDAPETLCKTIRNGCVGDRVSQCSFSPRIPRQAYRRGPGELPTAGGSSHAKSDVEYSGTFIFMPVVGTWPLPLLP